MVLGSAVKYVGLTTQNGRRMLACFASRSPDLVRIGAPKRHMLGEDVAQRQTQEVGRALDYKFRSYLSTGYRNMFKESAKTAAIPTVYNGIQMRSRLEAKWACFFDSLGWHWQYEAIDLAGWIPDFLLFSEEKTVLVEVKPDLTFPQDVARKCYNAGYNNARGLLILKNFPTIEHGEFKIGWVTDCFESHGDLDQLWDEPVHNWDEARIIGPRQGRYGVCAVLGHWGDRLHDVEGKYGADDPHHLMGLWRVACNTAQWKAPR